MFSLFKKVYSVVVPTDSNNSVRDLQAQLNEKLAKLDDEEERDENEDDVKTNDTKDHKIDHNMCFKKNGKKLLLNL